MNNVHNIKQAKLDTVSDIELNKLLETWDDKLIEKVREEIRKRLEMYLYDLID